jgi:hypothetical protein
MSRRHTTVLPLVVLACLAGAPSGASADEQLPAASLALAVDATTTAAGQPFTATLTGAVPRRGTLDTYAATAVDGCQDLKGITFLMRQRGVPAGPFSVTAQGVLPRPGSYVICATVTDTYWTDSDTYGTTQAVAALTVTPSLACTAAQREVVATTRVRSAAQRALRRARTAAGRARARAKLRTATHRVAAAVRRRATACPAAEG